MTSRTARMLKLALERDYKYPSPQDESIVINKKTQKTKRPKDQKKDRPSLLGNDQNQESQITDSLPKEPENILNCTSGTNEKCDELIQYNIEDMEIIFADKINDELFPDVMESQDYETIFDNIRETAAIELTESEIVETPETEKETINDKEENRIILEHNMEVGRPSAEDDPNWGPEIGQTSLEDEEETDGSQSSNSESNYKKVERRRNKRHRVKPETWVREANQRKREKGFDYLGRKNVEGKWKYDLPKTQRNMKKRCGCARNLKVKKLQCSLLTEKDRECIFQKYWKLSWDEKRIHVTTLVERKNTARSRNRKVENQSRRSCSYNYFLQRIDGTKLRVCQTMFANTLAMQPWTIIHWLKAGVEEKRLDKKGKVVVTDKSVCGTSANMTNEEPSLVLRRKCLRFFFDLLPKMESHYCRSSSSKLYLEPTWKSKAELFTEYQSWMAIHHPNLRSLSISVFYHIFSDLNLSLFSPKKDECDLCVAHRTGNIGDEEYQNHQLRKKQARDAKEKDKTSGDEIKVYTLDMQAVLLCPKSNVSALYYKTKLAVHNYTIFDLKTKDGFCFLWHESEGGLVASVYASILVNFLSSEIEKYAKEYYVIYSDGCTSQNRNVIMSNALLNLAVLKKVTIIQKYLERGHTQMECDSMHSRIEGKLKNCVINVPADYVTACQQARKHPKPYYVEYLSHTFFKDFTSLKTFTTIRPGIQATVNEIRQLKYNPDGTIEFKLHHGDDWSQLCARKTARISAKNHLEPLDVNDLPKLYPRALPIKKTKYDHLQSLKSTMPSDYHGFFDQLPYNNNCFAIMKP